MAEEHFVRVGVWTAGAGFRGDPREAGGTVAKVRRAVGWAEDYQIGLGRRDIFAGLSVSGSPARHIKWFWEIILEKTGSSPKKKSSFWIRLIPICNRHFTPPPYHHHHVLSPSQKQYAIVAFKFCPKTNAHFDQIC